MNMRDKQSSQSPRWTTNPNIAAETCGSGFPFGTNTVNNDYRYTRQTELGGSRDRNDGSDTADTGGNSDSSRGYAPTGSDIGDGHGYAPTGDSGQDYEEDEMLNMKACSAMECTGLIPSLPLSDSELESYAEIYHYPADVFRN